MPRVVLVQWIEGMQAGRLLIPAQWKWTGLKIFDF